MSSVMFMCFLRDATNRIFHLLTHSFPTRLSSDLLVLQDIGPRISAQLRPQDTLARLGGDEFCVLLPHMTASAAGLVARQIVAALEDPFEIDGMLLAVAASCGLVVAPEQGDTADLLLQRPDVAPYLSKRPPGVPVRSDDRRCGKQVVGRCETR